MKSVIIKLVSVTCLFLGLFTAAQASTASSLMPNFTKSNFTAKSGSHYTDDQYREILTSQIWVHQENGISIEMQFFKNGYLNVDFYKVSPRVKLAYAKANWRVTNAQLCTRFYEESDPNLGLVTGIEHCWNLEDK